MIQMQTNLDVADNSGAKKVQCIKVLGGAHDESNKFKNGDIVRIQECSPFSKSKRWEVLTN